MQEDVSQWDHLVSQALPVVEYYLQAVVSKFDLESPKDKVAAAHEVFPLIREIVSDVERSHYMGKLAVMLRVDERVLHREMQHSAAQPRRPVTGLERHGRLSSAPGLTFGLERYVLSVLLWRPELLVTMNGVLVDLDLEPLAGEDFAGVEERTLFEQLVDHVAQYDELDVKRLLQDIEPELREGLESLLSLGKGVPWPSQEQAESDAVIRAIGLRELRLRRRNEELHYLLKDAREQGDADAERGWKQRAEQLTAQLDRLQREKGARSTLGYTRGREQSRG